MRDIDYAVLLVVGPCIIAGVTNLLLVAGYWLLISNSKVYFFKRSGIL